MQLSVLLYTTCRVDITATIIMIVYAIILYM